MADPWGFPERPKDVVLRQNVPFLVRAIAYVMQPFNPFWAIRAAGPWGKFNIGKTNSFIDIVNSASYPNISLSDLRFVDGKMVLTIHKMSSL